MEKLTIKPWQVMQAFENGADIEMSLIGSSKWSNSIDVLWNWYMRNYRIADLTADGMRLDELVEKWPDTIYLYTKLTSSNGPMLSPCVTTNTLNLISFLCEYPECIAKVKVNQDKKLRPWTMEEFEKHKDEWFTWLDGERRKILSFGNGYVRLYNMKNETSMEVFLKEFTREDGSPCGVLE